MTPLQLSIRRAISAKGGRATSDAIARVLKRSGQPVNRHTLLKALRLPEFVLTNRGWANTLRQRTILEDLPEFQEAACASP